MASGMYRPDKWLDFLGSWSEAYTVRRFWDRTWYQKMRRWRTVPGNLIAQRWMGLRAGSRGCKYVKLFVGFCMNRLMHQIADYALRQRGFGNFTSGASMMFFVMQVGAIVVEDGVIALGRQFGVAGGERRWVGVVGYAWTIGWFAFSIPIFDPCFRDGLVGGEVFSLIGRLWKRDWMGKVVKIALPLDY
ncbi:hypothetical protein GYMLUDRAFT_78618 [Collybiopsis luxurians FD-317 M1]|uniref:Wax synthase domain-containing protein n=1 Tax=Collybiopsis luxurians FD-317 M1 TaxID=944289 RepID=A0A0D0C4X4_9AGAR|nr:hypothetical protein GYMLUDRAFT_78618 [Collybiopsis luxurians FD-317 M1]